MSPPFSVMFVGSGIAPVVIVVLFSSLVIVANSSLPLVPIKSAPTSSFGIFWFIRVWFLLFSIKVYFVGSLQPNRIPSLCNFSKWLISWYSVWAGTLLGEWKFSVSFLRSLLSPISKGENSDNDVEESDFFSQIGSSSVEADNSRSVTSWCSRSILFNVCRSLIKFLLWRSLLFSDVLVSL